MNPIRFEQTVLPLIWGQMIIAEAFNWGSTVFPGWYFNSKEPRPRFVFCKSSGQSLVQVNNPKFSYPNTGNTVCPGPFPRIVSAMNCGSSANVQTFEKYWGTFHTKA